MGKVLWITALVAVLFWGVVGGLLMLGMYWQAKTDPAAFAHQEPTKPKIDPAMTRALVGAGRLKASMREPESFKLESAFLVEGGTVCYTFRSRNGFGGMNRGHAIFPSYFDQVFTDDSNGFAALWEKECSDKPGNEVASRLILN